MKPLLSLYAHHPYRWLTIISLAMIASGCSLINDFQRVKQEKLVEQQAYLQLAPLSLESNSQEPLTQWWHQFNQPQINQLVDQALAHNFELKQAAANVLESQALLDSAFGRFWPSLDLGVSGSREYLRTTVAENYTTQYGMNLSLSWQLDLFGRLRNNYSAAVADLSALERDRDALIHSLIANVLRQYVEQVIAKRRLRVAEQIAASRQLTLKTVDRRYRNGVIGTSAVDVRLGRENLLSAQANVSALQLNVELANHALDILLGQAPIDRRDDQPELTTLPTLDQQQIGIPLSLLDRRPDLKAAEFRSIARNHRIGVALADLYPDLTLTGRLGTNSESLSRFFSLDNLIASIAGELATTIFQGGSLRAEVEAARARLQAQAASYSQSVIIAVREVEDALASNRLLDQRLVQVTEQLLEARQAEKLAKQRYGRGIDSLLIVLETERRRQNAEDLLLRVEQLRWNSRIDLHLAIGGNWLDSEQLALSIIGFMQIGSKPNIELISRL